MGNVKFRLDGSEVSVDAAAAMPLLYVLRNKLGLNSPHFGCGLAQCGACTVHLDGEPIRSCVFPASAVQGKSVTTLVGLGDAGHPHPVQQAFIDEQVPQCGYCLSGWVMTAAAVLKKNPEASDAQLREAFAGLKCRCGTHLSIMRAVKRAQTVMKAKA